MSLRDELLGIRNEYGRLTAETVVEVARDPGHPLHDRFEWDDAIAGEAFRREQARLLIRSVRIPLKNSNHGSTSVRAFYAMPSTEPTKVYDPTEEIMADPMSRKILLNDMKRRIAELETTYGHLNEFWDQIKRLKRRKRAS